MPFKSIAVAFVLLASTVAAAEPLQYHLPPGWVDLADPKTNTAGYPANAVHEARTGKYRIYAIEAETALPQGARALMNVIEVDTRGRVTEDVLNRAAQEAQAQASSMHLELAVLDKRLAKLGDVDIGVVDSTLGNAASKFRLRQYFVPGSPKSAVITYGCDPLEFDHYRPTFEASAMATTGAHVAGFNLKSMLGGAFIGAIIGAIVFGVMAMGKSRAAAHAVATGTALPMTWECASCKRRVPLRIAECRCGTARP